jgi:hypothetical protein
LSAAAVAAGVLSDGNAALGLSKKADARPDHAVRVVCIRIQPHAKRSHRKGNTGAGPSDGVLRIATDLLDVPAGQLKQLLTEKRQPAVLTGRDHGDGA